MFRAISFPVKVFWLCAVLVHGAVIAADTPVSSPLLKNRFRLDPGIDEVSLVIYRASGSAPAILVQPDGSKLYASRHPEEVKWHDEVDYDLITIKQPMPGPWQIVGAVDPRNRIVILSDLQLALDQHYDALYTGEVLKLTARIENQTQKLDLKPFLGKLKLDVWSRLEGLSEHYDLDVTGEHLAGYGDDGQGMDEYADDGIFSGELRIGISEGQYQLVFQAHNPTFERQLTMPLRVLAPPASIKLNYQNEQPQSFQLQLTEGPLLPESIAFSGEVAGPRGAKQPFAASALDQVIAFDKQTVAGDYTISLRLFATMADGREIIVDLPPKRYSLVLPTIDPRDIVAGQGVALALPESKDGNQMENLLDEVTRDFHRGVKSLQQMEQPRPGLNWWWIIGVNLLLLALIIGVVVLFKLRSLRVAQRRAVENGPVGSGASAPQTTARNEAVDLTLPED